MLLSKEIIKEMCEFLPFFNIKDRAKNRPDRQIFEFITPHI